MIIYYDNETGKIYGAIMGRVHTEHELKPDLIQPNNVDKSRVSRRIFSLDETKQVENYLGGNQIKLLDCDIDLTDENYLFIKRKNEKSK